VNNVTVTVNMSHRLSARQREAHLGELVEVLHAMHSEGALEADDVLDRRTRIGLVPADRARAEATVRELVEAAPLAAAA
jgi:glycerol-3-phosphate dehydrogenase